MPKISVIIPIFKVEKYIHRCIDSVLAQTFSDFELILVDDGSPDNCGAICDEYAKKDYRIRVIHQENGGLSAARNSGVDLVFKENITEWITFIDSDDWVHPKYLEQLYIAATENGVGMSICEHIRTEKVLEYTANIERAVVYDSEDYYIKDNTNSITAWGKLYKTELFGGIRYPVGKIHEDEYTTYKPLFAAGRVAVIHTPMYFYFVNQDGITGNSWSINRMQSLDAFPERLKYLKDRNFKKAYSRTLPIYEFIVVKTMNGVNESKCVDENKAILKDLRKHLRYVIKLKKKNGDMQGKKEDNLYIYELAYPRGMKIYWYKVAVLKKLGIKR